MPTYFIASPQVRGEFIHIVGPLLKHLKDALRVKPGESLMFVDEERQRYVTRVERVNPQLLVARIKERLEPGAPPLLSLTMAQGIIKGKKMDWIVQKATEIGVSRFVPLLTGRTVVRFERSKSEHQQERWQAIAHEAAQQSGQDRVPRIEPICTFADFLRTTDDQPRLILWEEENERSLKAALDGKKNSNSATLTVGPEGGFSREEVEQAKRTGFLAVHLGQRILRSETAGLVTLSILQYIWGDLGNE
jgi:16S rRNA (uracil1498-N3)-methyltransferase